MKGVLILLVTAIVVCVGNRTQGVHKHRHGKTGHNPERDTGSILGYLVLAYAIKQFFRPVTWCKGYKYNKKCALYIFVYDEGHERYSPLKIMSLKGQMHNYRMTYTGEGISLTLVRSWTYDTMTISWGGV